jgi:large subunit ribosomal protein L21
MYAVVRTGGRQFRVEPGAAVRVEKLDGSVGESVELSEVLLVGGEGDSQIGTPLVDGAKVVGTITAQGRGPKITIFKMKRRKGYRRKQGHRQDYTEIRVDKIEA